jgi:hypothetical protein
MGNFKKLKYGSGSTANGNSKYIQYCSRILSIHAHAVYKCIPIGPQLTFSTDLSYPCC